MHRKILVLLWLGVAAPHTVAAQTTNCTVSADGRTITCTTTSPSSPVVVCPGTQTVGCR